jgi:hypothetical protein
MFSCLTECCPARQTAIGEKADKSWQVCQEARRVMLEDAQVAGMSR